MLLDKLEHFQDQHSIMDNTIQRLTANLQAKNQAVIEITSNTNQEYSDLQEK